MLSEMFNKNYSGVAKTMINAGWVGEDTKEVELEVVIRTVLDPIFEKPFDEIKFGEMLLYLFDATRKFDLSLPTSLLLLNKTLINIEGLADKFIQNWICGQQPSHLFNLGLQKNIARRQCLKDLKMILLLWQKKLTNFLKKLKSY